MPEKLQVFEDLERLGELAPVTFYWTDVNAIIVGVNHSGLKIIGNLSYQDIVGKSPYDLYPPKTAQMIYQNTLKVVETGKTLSFEEELADLTTGKMRYYIATRSPLFEDGKIVGTVGVTTEITGEKEAALLALENVAHKAQLEEQEKFAETVNQVAHDIRSPVASLLMIVKSCIHLPEPERVALREAAISISDIANHLLSRYRTKENISTLEIERSNPILVSATLLQLLTDKKYQCQNLPIKFYYDFTQKGYFGFIQMPLSDFKRMISNLINNAVDAYEEGQAGSIILKVDMGDKDLNIILQDNGKGMPLAVVNKILQNVTVTEGKTGGHGLGLTQVRETLQRNHGELFIDSQVGYGTCMTLKFPCIQAPEWFANSILLNPQDIVVILDDDASIHIAWDARFENLLKIAPQLEVKHFKQGGEAIRYIDNLSSIEKEKVFLLTDFELLKQELNGLDVIERTQVKRSILVTSHYAHSEIQVRAVKIGTKILPKLLAPEVPMSIQEKAEINYENQTLSLKSVDLILVDDDQSFAQNLMLFIFGNKIVDYFEDPSVFQKQVLQYPKNTPIYLDNNFASVSLKGLELAKMLHQQGYTRLYLLTGETFSLAELPPYLTVIRKDEIDRLRLSVEGS